MGIRWAIFLSVEEIDFADVTLLSHTQSGMQQQQKKKNKAAKLSKELRLKINKSRTKMMVLH